MIITDLPITASVNNLLTFLMLLFLSGLFAALSPALTRLARRVADWLNCAARAGAYVLYCLGARW